jgi:hypothetical protein
LIYANKNRQKKASIKGAMEDERKASYFILYTYPPYFIAKKCSLVTSPFVRGKICYSKSVSYRKILKLISREGDKVLPLQKLDTKSAALIAPLV